MKAKALLIGNSAYPSQILDNPTNDANDLNDVLIRLGFQTILQIDATAVIQDQVIINFVSDLDKFDIGLFYFAGHGFQIEDENYLAAIDTNFQDEDHAKHSAFPLKILLSYLNKSKNKTNIIVLDACRELLNKKSFYRSASNAGLAPMFAPKGTIIAYATSPGERALDGTGERNGVYTRALLEHITVEHIPIEEMFKRVRNSVFAYSKGRQTSWEHTSLTGGFYFNSGQLSHSITIQYINNVIQDQNYKFDESMIDGIIKDLKTYNWYLQNPAIARLDSIEITTIDKNKLFLLGRNILQSATGGSGAAGDFMISLNKSLTPFNLNSENHVLNGIIYEIFFNSYGSFRQDDLKDQFLQEVHEILENPIYVESLKFFSDILTPYVDIVFYNPFINTHGISLETEFVNGEDPVTLANIKLEGQNILRIFDDSHDGWGKEGEISYMDMNLDELKYKLHKELRIPINKLTVTTSHSIKNSSFRFPKNYRFIK